jgi:hypothetical protein
MPNTTPTADERRARAQATVCLLLATGSVLLGAASVVLFGNLALAVPALAVGLVSLRWINGSDGRLPGRWLAVAGLVLGGVGALVGVAGHVALVLLPLRMAAAREQSAYNLGQIGIAVNAYHDHQQPPAYPQAVVPNPALPADCPDRHLSWLAAILPYLEEAVPAGTARGTPPGAAKVRRIAGQIDFTKAWDAAENRLAVDTVLSQFLCPANRPRSAPGTPGRTSYVGLAGVGPGAAALPAGDPQAGFFGYNRLLSREDLVGKDGRGTSHILMATETTRDNGPWAQGGPATVRGVDPVERPYFGPGRPFGGCQPGGFHALFADGSVMYFKDAFDPAKFEALVLLKTAREEP